MGRRYHGCGTGAAARQTGPVMVFERIADPTIETRRSRSASPALTVPATTGGEKNRLTQMTGSLKM